VVDGQAMLDLCYEEDSTAQVDFNVVMTGLDEFVEVQGTAEGKPFSRGEMDGLVDLARNGINELFAKQRAVLEAAQA
jgi:ribonuclease PH